MNDDNLINLVRQYPHLYNKSMWEYKDTNKKREIWNMIAKELGSTGEFCMKRWTNLRDRYGRILNQSKAASGSGATPAIKWQHFEHLSFLSAHMQTKKQRSNFNTVDILDMYEPFSPPLPSHVEPFSPPPLSPTPAQKNATPSQPPTPTPSHLEPFSPPPAQKNATPSQPPTPTPSHANSTQSRQRKRKVETEAESAAFCEVSNALKTYLETPSTTVKDQQAHSFGQFVEHSLAEMTPLKKIKVIADITNLILAAQINEN